MIYVMADLHGEYDKFLAMLRKIKFSDEDVLYIIGDIVDRGPQPVRILQDISMRFNVYPILGNHEVMAFYTLKKLVEEITEENYDTQIDEETMQGLLEWQMNGGNSTIAEFKELTQDERMDLLEYMEEFTTYEIVEVRDKIFLLVHAGLGNFSEEKTMEDYTLSELVFSRCDYERQYFKDPSIYLVTGHTPTLAINGKPEIYKKNNNICIDCGAVFTEGRLACLCLDTMEEFYV